MAINGVNGAKKPGSVLDHSGYLFNEYSKGKEYMVLRAGVLRIRTGPKGSDLAVLYIFAVGTEVRQLPNCKLQIRCRVPHAQEYLFTAESEAEAEVWHEMLRASIKSAENKTRALLEHIYSGSTMHKYNYSNSKRSRRFFWVQKDELCWGRAKTDSEVQNVNLKECLGIVYGPMTTTFQRCDHREDPDWACFSLLFTGRTLDLAVAGDLQIHAWLLGLQHLISQHGVGSMPIMSEGEFYRRKVQYKLMSVAHQNGLVLSRFLLMKVKEAGRPGAAKAAPASTGGLGGLGAGALVSGGPLAQPMQVFSPKKEKKKRDKEPLDPEAQVRIEGLKEQVLKLQAMLRQRCAEADGQEELLRRAKEGKISASQELSKELQEITLDVLSKRCKALEAQAQQLTESNEQMAPQAKDAGKSERSLKKLQSKLEECDARKRSLEQELGIAASTTAKESGALNASSKAKKVAQSRSQELQQRVHALEQQLKTPQQAAPLARQAALDNKRHDEAIAKGEQEKLHLAQRLEALEQEQKRVLETEKKLLERLTKSQKANQSLDARCAPLKVAAQAMRTQQQRLRTEVTEIGTTFNGEVKKMLEATSKVRDRTKALEHKHNLAIEDRDKLQTLVAELEAACAGSPSATKKSRAKAKAK